jgi:hypothetical protein
MDTDESESDDEEEEEDADGVGDEANDAADAAPVEDVAPAAGCGWVVCLYLFIHASPPFAWRFRSSRCPSNFPPMSTVYRAGSGADNHAAMEQLLLNEEGLGELEAKVLGGDITDVPELKEAFDALHNVPAARGRIKLFVNMDGEITSVAALLLLCATAFLLHIGRASLSAFSYFPCASRVSFSCCSLLTTLAHMCRLRGW